ncbi:MAG: iron-sulfur cluster assembly accessory protein [Thiohalomonadaceae bacterium]
MIKVTPEAAKQILLSATQNNMDNMALRLAARPTMQGSLEYGMGFDDPQDDDLSFTCEGIHVVMEAQYGPQLQGTTIDFVELEPGQFHFIFMNPNDPGCSSGGGGGCSSGGCGSGGGCS